MAAAAATCAPVTLELGGKSPAIVADDFPLATAAERILFVKCLNAGQICTSVDHAWLPTRRIDAFVALAQQIVAKRYPTLDSPDYTSIVDQRSFERLLRTLDEARQRGARVVPLLPGPAFDAASRKIAPHIVVDAPLDTELMQREIFGPICRCAAHQLDTVIDAINAAGAAAGDLPVQPRPGLRRPSADAGDVGGVSVNDACCTSASTTCLSAGRRVGHGALPRPRRLRDLQQDAPGLPPGAVQRDEVHGPPYGRFAESMLRYLIKK